MAVLIGLEFIGRRLLDSTSTSVTSTLRLPVRDPARHRALWKLNFPLQLTCLWTEILWCFISSQQESVDTRVCWASVTPLLSSNDARRLGQIQSIKLNQFSSHCTSPIYAKFNWQILPEALRTKYLFKFKRLSSATTQESWWMLKLVLQELAAFSCTSKIVFLV